MSFREIFILGDSISIHYGPHLKKMTEGIFRYDRKRGEEEAKADLDNPVGANGGDSRMVLEYLENQHALGVSYDILVLNCGLHDIKTNPKTGCIQVPIEEYKENLRKIILLASLMAKETIWVRTTPIDETIHNSKMNEFHRFNKDNSDYNYAADEIMKEKLISTIDLYTFTKNLDKNLYLDHVHFNEDIRQLQAAFIAGYLATLQHNDAS